MALTQYDPIQVIGTWSPSNFASIDILDGRISGEFVVSARDNPVWTREFDAHGNATRVKNNNKGGTVTITLSASSPTNDSLSIAVQTDRLGENVVGALVLKDLNGTTLLTAQNAFLVDVPDVSFGAERGARSWTFECSAIELYVGGHDTL